MLLRSLALRDEAMALCDIVMDWRSLALREGMALPCDDMDLWKLAPINDISTFGSLVMLLR